MDRALPTFNEAQERVKISHFTKQGYDITGIMHVGANDGYEIEHYLNMGICPVLAFEPLDSAREIMFQKYGNNLDVSICDMALGNVDGEALLHVTDGDGKGSSMLLEDRQIGLLAGVQKVSINRFSTLIGLGRILPRGINCCVIDVQGLELDVLRGMDEHLKQFDFLSVECSLYPIYKGEADVHEVVSYLNRMGFHCDTPAVKLPAHDDVFFINTRVLVPAKPQVAIPQGRKLNIGSGQRCFGKGWVNIDAVSRPGQVPDLILDVGNQRLPYEDESIDYVVLHQVYEHFGLGEGHGMLREINRVLAPGGSLIVTVPDMEALARRWLAGELDDYLYMVNVYGAYQGEPGDRHKWGYDLECLMKDLRSATDWKALYQFDFRPIAGADIARDWWILGVEAIK